MIDRPPIPRLPAVGRSALRRRFQKQPVIRLSGLLPVPFVRSLSAGLAKVPFTERTSAKISRQVPQERYWQALLIVLLHDQGLLDFVRAAAGGPALRSVKGILCRMTCDHERHFVDWHRDPRPSAEKWADVTLTINVGRSYRGGILEISTDPSRPPVRAANARPGDALLFRNDLLHRSTPVLGPHPKDLFVAWFSPLPSPTLAACRMIVEDPAVARRLGSALPADAIPY